MWVYVPALLLPGHLLVNAPQKAYEDYPDLRVLASMWET